MIAEDRGPSYACGDLEQVAAELGLGVLTGTERADALAHLDRCARCRALVGEIAQVGDAVLGLAPDADPPAGFAERVLGRQQHSWAGHHHTRRRWLAVVTAAAAVAVAFGVAVVLGGSGRPGFRVEHPATVSALGGRNLAVAALRHQGLNVGEVFAYSGSPSWVFMTVDGDGTSQPVTCELETKTGHTVRLGTFGLSSGYRSWGSTLTIDPAAISTVRLVTNRGQVLSTAIFPS